MMMTIANITKCLLRLDETLVCDLLEITTEDLIEEFSCRISLKQGFLSDELDFLDEPMQEVDLE